jgi:uncharacterized repeat protein (TIGR03806 family)
MTPARPARGVLLALMLALPAAPLAWTATPEAHPYGLDSRKAPPAYLRMPQTIDGKLPPRLSQTGAFRDTRTLTASDGLIPYELVVAFWSDGARKLRWVSVPNGKIHFAPSGEWSFPNGTVFVKTFELPTDETDPSVVRRLETRLLVRDSHGAVYGVVYKWRPDGSDADLLSSSLTERIPIKQANGAVRQQSWYYPSRHDCLTCHTAGAGGVLGVKTRQVNRDYTYPSGNTDNELRAWNHIGLFAPGLREEDIAHLDRLAAADDVTRSLEDRARSYLDANCSQCHRPGGTVASFDARYDTPPAKQELVDGPVLIGEGIDHARIIAPHDIWRSMAFVRVNTDGDLKMPPLARETIDLKGVALLREWILSMPGPAVLDPPDITPDGGSFARSVRVVLKEKEAGAVIHYTLDGSAPGPSDPRYEHPLELDQSTVVRARAYKDGFTRSVISQEVFVVGAQR